jgi:hypothetical protein
MVVLPPEVKKAEETRKMGRAPIFVARSAEKSG